MLKPGGRFVLQDFRNVDEYAAALGELGARDVRVTPRTYLLFPPGRSVTGRKA